MAQVTDKNKKTKHTNLTLKSYKKWIDVIFCKVEVIYLTSQLFLFGPVAEGVHQRPQSVLHPRTQLQEAGVPYCQPSEGYR